MHVNKKRSIYVWAIAIIFLAIVPSLLAKDKRNEVENKIKVGVEVKNEEVIVTLVGKEINEGDVLFKVEDAIIQYTIKPNNSNKKKKFKLSFQQYKNKKVNLRIFYKENCIGSSFLLVPLERGDIKVTDVKIEEEYVQITFSGVIYDMADIEFSVSDIFIENEKLGKEELKGKTDNGNIYKYKLIFPYELKVKKKVELKIFNNKKLIESVFLEFPEPKEDITVADVMPGKDFVQICLTGAIDNEDNLEFKVNETVLLKQRLIGNSKYENVYRLMFPYEVKNERINLKVFYEKNCIASFPLLVPDDKKHLTITYDCMDLKNPLRDNNSEKYVVSYRKHATFRIINANPLRYRVTLSGQTKNYFIESPKDYQDIAKEAMAMKVSELVQEPPESLTTVAANVANEAKKEEENKREVLKLKENLKNLAQKEFDEAKQRSDKAEMDYNEAITKKDSAFKYMNTAEEEKKNAVTAFNEIKEKISEKEKELQGKTPEQQIEINKEIEKMKAELGYGSAEQNKTKKENDYQNKKYLYEQEKEKCDSKENDYKDQKEEMEKKGKALIDKKNEYEILKNAVTEKVEKLESVQNFLNAYNNLSKIEEFYNRLVTQSLSNDSVADIQKNIEPILETILTEKSKTEGINRNYEFYLDNIVPILKRWLKEAQDAYPKIDFDWLDKTGNLENEKFSPENIKIIRLCKERMDKIVEMDIIGKIQTLISVIKKPENFVQSITIPNVDSDEVHFTARIEGLPNLVSTTDSVSKIIGPIVVKVRSGWAINFSTGAVFHYEAHDRSYRLEKASTQGNDSNFTKYTIEENENKHSITPSVAGLMHIYPRSVQSVKWGGIVFGIGTKDSEKFHYYIGTSLMLGSPRRFVISGGLVITKIDYLKTEYTKDGSITLPAATDITKLTLVDKQYKARIFLGFTYNLTVE